MAYISCFKQNEMSILKYILFYFSKLLLIKFPLLKSIITLRKENSFDKKCYTYSIKIYESSQI